MWASANRGFNAAFDAFLWPFSGLPDWLQLAAVALVATAFALLVFRWVSDQAGIEDAKDKIKAYLLELLLYKDDLGVTLRAQGNLMRHNLVYIRKAILPMLVMIGPMLLIIIQLESRFAFRSFEPGESALLSVEVEEDVDVSALDAALELPAGLARETPALRIGQDHEVVWRVRAEEPGAHDLQIRIGDATASKRAVVAGNGEALAPSIYRASDLTTLLYPRDDALANEGAIRAIHLEYPRQRGEFAGLSSASWLFFGMTLVGGFALRGFFGVTF